MSSTDGARDRRPGTLTARHRATLKRLGHPLKALIAVGKEGLSLSLAQQLDRQLTDHELVKVKILNTVTDDRHDVAAKLADATKSELVQVIGRTVLLYRRHPEAPRIDLDAAQGD